MNLASVAGSPQRLHNFDTHYEATSNKAMGRDYTRNAFVSVKRTFWSWEAASPAIAGLLEN
jgi:hypothetical protein